MSDIGKSIADALPPLSHLECSTCGKRREVGDVGRKFQLGWPTCCKGHTMHLFTQRQVDAEAVVAVEGPTG